MKSPFTGKEMKRVYEKRTWNFRGEEYEYEYTAWRCEDTGEQFTTDATDTALGFAANTAAPTVQVNATVTVTQVD